jgi:dTMP kinase
MPNSYFVTFEGGEGVGKSTQIQKLSAYLDRQKIDHIVTREPGGSPVAEAIRILLVRGQENKIDVLTEYLLFSAARRDHLVHTIKPTLARNQWVICDRFYDSSYVYQGFAQGLDLNFIQQVYDQLAENFEPQLTFILTADPKQALERALARAHHENRFERKDLGFHQKIHQGFLELAQRFPHRCVLINADHPEDIVFADIQTALEERILHKQGSPVKIS